MPQDKAPGRDEDRLLILLCSPHQGGSSSAAARFIAEGALIEGRQSTILPLWKTPVAGCTHCNACAKPPHACSLKDQDACEDLFTIIRSHRQVLWISPVYFYGLPAQAKALIDRTQRFYAASLAALPGGGRPEETGRAAALFVAGQTGGKKLFDGSRLAVKYGLQTLGCPLVHAYGLRGVNEPQDAAAARDALNRLGQMLAGSPAPLAPPLEELLP